MEEVSSGSPRVVDLVSREEVVRWTRGEIEAWTSKNPSRILYWFGPKGQKQLGEWSEDERESLLVQINGREVSSPDEWGLISIGILRQQRTGQQCETQAELLWRRGSITKGQAKLELSWVSERNDEAFSLVSQKKVEQSLPVFAESNTDWMCCELEDGRAIPSPSRLLLDASRSVNSARMQPAVQLDEEDDKSEKDERISRSKKRRMKTRRKPTDRSLKQFSSSKASSTAQDPEANDEDVLAMVLPWRRTSNTSVSGGEAISQSVERESNNFGVGFTPAIGNESPRPEGEDESSVWDVPRIHSQGSRLNKPKIDEEEEVVHDEGVQIGDFSEEVQSDPAASPIMKRRMNRAITLSPSTASAGSAGEKNTNPPIGAASDKMQVTFTSAGMNSRDLYRQVRNELIQKHLDHALVLLRKERSARLESEYQTMAHAANSLLSTLRKEYGVVDDDRDDEFFDWEGADEEMPPRMSPATYTRLRSYNKEESHRRLKKVLKESASIWKELKEMKIIAANEATSSNEEDDQWWDSETPAEDDEHLFTDSEEEDDENANLSQRVSIKKARNVVDLGEAIEVRAAKRNSAKGVTRKRKKMRRDESRAGQTESRDKGPSSRQTHMNRFAHLVVSDDDDEASSEGETTRGRQSHPFEMNSNRHMRLFATASYPSQRAVSGTEAAPTSIRETSSTPMPPSGAAARSALFRTRPRALRNADDTSGVLIGEDFILPSTRNAASLGPFPSRRSVVASATFSSLENKQGHGESLADLVDYIDAEEGPVHDNDVPFYLEGSDDHLIDDPSNEAIVVPARPARSDQFLGERFLDGVETIDQRSSSSSSSSLCYRPQRRGMDALSLVSDFFVNPSRRTFGDLDDAFAFDGVMSAAMKNPLSSPDKLKTLYDLVAFPLLELCFSKPKRTEYVSYSSLDSYFNVESNVLNIETSVLSWSIVLGDKPLAMFLCTLLMHQFLCRRIRTGDRWLSRSDTTHEQSLWATTRKAATVFRFSVWSPFNAVMSAWLEDPLRFGKAATSKSIMECLQQLSGEDSNHNHLRGELSFKRFAKELCQSKLSSAGAGASSTSPIRSRLEWCEFVWGALFTMSQRLLNKQRGGGNNQGGGYDGDNWQWVLEYLLPNQAFWKQEPLKQVVESAVTQLSGGLDPRHYVWLILRRCRRLLELWGSPSSSKSLSGIALMGLLNTAAGVLSSGGLGIGDDDDAFVEFRSLFVKEMTMCSSVGSRLRLGTDVVTRGSSFKASTTVTTGWVMETIAEQCCVLSLVLTTMKDQTSKILKKILSFVSQFPSVVVDQHQQNHQSSTEDDVSCLRALVRATKALEDAFVLVQQQQQQLQQPETPLSTCQISGNLSKATSATIQTWWSAAALGNAAPGDVFMLLLKEGHTYLGRQQGRGGGEIYPSALEKMIESLSRLVVLRDKKTLSAIPLVSALGSMFIQNEIWMQAPRVTLAALDVIHRIVHPILHPDTDGEQGLDEDTLMALAMDRTDAQTQVVKSLAPFFRSMLPLVVTDLFFTKDQDVHRTWRIVELAADLAGLSVSSAEVQQDLVFRFGHADRWRTVSNPAACGFSQSRDFFLVPLRFLLCLTTRNEASLVDLLDLKSVFAVFWRSLIVLGPHPTSLLLPPMLAEFTDRVLMPKIRRERAAQQGPSSSTIQRSDSFSASMVSWSSSLFSIESILREFTGLQPSCMDPVEALLLSGVVANGEEEHALNEWKMSVERLMISIPQLATSVEMLDRLVTVVVRTRNLFLLATHLFLLIVCDERLGYDRFPPMAQRARKLFQLVPQYLQVQHLYIQAGVVSNAPVDLVRLRTFIVGDSSPSSPLRTLSSSEQRVILEWIGDSTSTDPY